MKNRLKLLTLIKILANKQTDIIGPFFIGDTVADAIEVVNDGSDFHIIFWIDSIEYAVPSCEITDIEIEYLLRQIEHLVANI